MQTIIPMSRSEYLSLLRSGDLKGAQIGREWKVRESVFLAWIREKFGEVGQEEKQAA